MYNRNKFYPSSNFDKFVDAIQRRDSKLVDQMLEERSKGLYFDLDEKRDGETLLEILLKKNDFKNAGKLIAAGAKTVFKEKVWVKDTDDCYPYGSYQTHYRSVFNNIMLRKNDLIELTKPSMNNVQDSLIETMSVSTPLSFSKSGI